MPPFPTNNMQPRNNVSMDRYKRTLMVNSNKRKIVASHTSCIHGIGEIHSTPMAETKISPQEYPMGYLKESKNAVDSKQLLAWSSGKQNFDSWVY